MKRKGTEPKGTNPPKTNPAKGRSGSGAKLSRDKRGDIVAHKKKDFAGVSSETLREDRKAKAGTGTGEYGIAAPRVGGKQKLIKSGPLKTATKKVIKQARRKPTGSAQARASQKRNNRF